MKFSATILALCALPAANAFMAHQPRAFSNTLKASDKNYSYLGNLNGDDEVLSKSTSVSATTKGTKQVSAPVSSSPSINGSAIQEQGVSPLAKYEAPKTTAEIFDEITPVTVQGGSLRTCSFNEEVERVSVYLKTEGRPLNANVELWQGPDNSPQKMTVYLEDGNVRPFRCIVESPGSSNAIAIRNTAEMEFPLIAGLDVDVDAQAESPAAILLKTSNYRTVQGGAVYTTPFSPAVKSVQVCLKSDGRPLNARIELLQGPNNNKQVMEVYTEDGAARPFFVIIDTPGTGNVVRIVNTATVEFPLTASCEPYIVDESVLEDDSLGAGGMTW
eukprot:CAMPEP_0197234600 /NCGR_PEP_ID=MMETSP1429-20130617/2303_1 /TAXON_ID=49237 /ORGANISM="Chaetoceros  sp., Strain UNC1202" /LENGTH=329 /DNA_ID=CAMNT_0042693045 /DNA_START=15 /DNA_END=1001 /DNA_ORIENTATION=+